MTGAEHLAAAERLIERAENWYPKPTPYERDRLYAAATAHATIAVARASFGEADRRQRAQDMHFYVTPSTS